MGLIIFICMLKKNPTEVFIAILNRRALIEEREGLIPQKNPELVCK